MFKNLSTNIKPFKDFSVILFWPSLFELATYAAFESKMHLTLIKS